MPKLQIDLTDEVDEAVEMAQIKIKHSDKGEKPSKKEVVEMALKWLNDEDLMEKAAEGEKHG